LAAPQTLLLLLALLALALALASLIPQIPAQAVGDPQAWLAVQQGVLARRGGLARVLGLFDLYHAFWFRLLLALGGVVLFVRTVDAAELAWRATGRGRWPPDRLPSWSGHVPRVRFLSGLPPEQVLDRSHDFLEKQGYALIERLDEPGRRLVARRKAVFFWARPLGYAALLLILAGLAISGYWGWQGEAWRPLPGESQPVGHDSPYSLRLDAFALKIDSQGRLQRYESRVTWLAGEREAREAVVSPGQPSSLGGVTVRQLGYLPVAELAAWDGQGRPLSLQTTDQDLPGAPQVRIRFLSADDRPLVFVTAQDRFLALAFEPLCSRGQPRLDVDLIREGGAGQQRLGSLTGNGQVTAEDLRLEVKLSYVPILRLDYHPGLELVLVGALLALLALIANTLGAPQLLWLAATDHGGEKSQVLALALPGARSRMRLVQATGRLQGVLADDG
jgi:cytochrome c biogenesis protein